MNRSLRFLGALFAALALAACDGLSAPDLAETTPAPARAAANPTPSLTLALVLGTTSPIGGGGSLTFDAVVSDTRCPFREICPWAGEARARFTLHSPDGTPYPFTLAIPGLLPNTQADPGGPPGPLPPQGAPFAEVGGYVVHLVRLQPYPGYPPEKGMAATATVVVRRCIEGCYGIGE